MQLSKEHFKTEYSFRKKEKRNQKTSEENCVLCSVKKFTTFFFWFVLIKPQVFLLHHRIPAIATEFI